MNTYPYEVRRVDGKEVQNPAYWVLDLNNDKYAEKAFEAYVTAAVADNPKLATFFEFVVKNVDLLGRVKEYAAQRQKELAS